MKPYFIKTPNLIKVLFKNWIWSFSKHEKVIYLTFDDGPTPEITDWTLNQLEKHNAKATFFCIGKNIVEHPEIFQKIIDNGHAVGNHTNNHLNNWKTTSTNYLKNIKDADKNISPFIDTKSSTSKLFRPPYGKLGLNSSKKLRNLGYKIIMWDVLSADFDITISPEKCLNNVMANVESGSIVVFHDSIKASNNLKYSLPRVLKHYTEKGFVFKKID